MVSQREFDRLRGEWVDGSWGDVFCFDWLFGWKLVGWRLWILFSAGKEMGGLVGPSLFDMDRCGLIGWSDT